MQNTKGYRYLNRKKKLSAVAHPSLIRVVVQHDGRSSGFKSHTANVLCHIPDPDKIPRSGQCSSPVLTTQDPICPSIACPSPLLIAYARSPICAWHRPAQLALLPRRGCIRPIDQVSELLELVLLLHKSGQVQRRLICRTRLQPLLHGRLVCPIVDIVVHGRG